MKGCFDPEIPVNIVDLGLIYDLKINDSDTDGRHAVNVKMTLTAQGCGMGPVIAEDAKKNIEALGAVSTRKSTLYGIQPWTPHMISDAGRQKLGLNKALQIQRFSPASVSLGQSCILHFA